MVQSKPVKVRFDSSSIELHRQYWKYGFLQYSICFQLIVKLSHPNILQKNNKMFVVQRACAWSHLYVQLYVLSCYVLYLYVNWHSLQLSCTSLLWHSFARFQGKHLTLHVCASNASSFCVVVSSHVIIAIFCFLSTSTLTWTTPLYHTCSEGNTFNPSC